MRPLIAEPNENLNDIANETLNQTGLNETLPDLNEIVPVENVTIEENATSEVMPRRIMLGVTADDLTACGNQIESSENAIFAIGGGLVSNDIFQINGNDRATRTF